MNVSGAQHAAFQRPVPRLDPLMTRLAPASLLALALLTGAGQHLPQRQRPARSLPAARPTALPVALAASGGGGAQIGTSYCGPAVVNVTGLPGTITAFGSSLVADNDVTLVATQLPTNTLGWFVASQTQGLLANAAGFRGTLCLSGTVSRFNWFPLDTGPLGEMTLQLDLTNIPSPTGWSMITAGTTWNFQALFRDSQAGQSTANLSDGVSIQFQ